MKKIFYLLIISLLFVQCEQVELDNSTKHKGHEYVDLGLSVKWATCNIGAENPEDYGDYFAWGEVKEKKYYNWDTYKYGQEGDYPTCVEPVIILSKYTKEDEKIILDPKDDVATIRWGKKWRIPTKAELDELKNNCTWIWSTQNEVKGYKIIGPNGNSIFLPAAGYIDNNKLQVAGFNGYYWSSSLSHKPAAAYNLNFSLAHVDFLYSWRCDGYSVRPVCQ